MYGSEKDQFVSIVIFHFRMEFAQWKSCENGTTQWNFVRWLARRRTAYGNVTATLTLSTFILLTLRVYEIISACTNVCLTLLAYRSTLIAVGYTPSELLMNRTLRTTVPTSRDRHSLQSRTTQKRPRGTELRSKGKRRTTINAMQQRSCLYCCLEVQCMFQTQEYKAKIVNQTATRSYLVQTDEGMYRRNCRHLIETPRSGTEVDTTICRKSSDGADTILKWNQKHLIHIKTIQTLTLHA